MVGVVTDHPLLFCQHQAGRVLVAGRFQTGSSKACNAMLDPEKKVLSGRSIGDNTDREQKSPKGLNMNNSLIHQGEKISPLAATLKGLNNKPTHEHLHPNPLSNLFSTKNRDKVLIKKNREHLFKSTNKYPSEKNTWLCERNMLSHLTKNTCCDLLPYMGP